ncbi:nascent polypeptide-associated complex subunit alpha, muscle-specific form-like [Panicum virgatum]|uniref:nascent polypeptide-associated complex subunit alpha, muscle-specific form-like n=1 Tax=Panicum virgatum TaxID=38727 RepID=UPI0019D63A1F|nr:nascent polypeptide-associated complex subunit alpha, muscle-specific form-like [Panicum virgatum]
MRHEADGRVRPPSPARAPSAVAALPAGSPTGGRAPPLPGSPPQWTRLYPAAGGPRRPRPPRRREAPAAAPLPVGRPPAAAPLPGGGRTPAAAHSSAAGGSGGRALPGCGRLRRLRPSPVGSPSAVAAPLPSGRRPQAATPSPTAGGTGSRAPPRREAPGGRTPPRRREDPGGRAPPHRRTWRTTSEVVHVSGGPSPRRCGERRAVQAFLFCFVQRTMLAESI